MAAVLILLRRAWEADADAARTSAAFKTEMRSGRNAQVDRAGAGHYIGGAHEIAVSFNVS